MRLGAALERSSQVGAYRFRWTLAPASRCSPTTPPTGSGYCSARPSRCTRPSGCALATRCTRRLAISHSRQRLRELLELLVVFPEHELAAYGSRRTHRPSDHSRGTPADPPADQRALPAAAPILTGLADTTSAFAGSRARMERLVGFLNSEEAAGLPLAELEARLDAERQELVNALMQDHAELRTEHDRTTG